MSKLSVPYVRGSAGKPAAGELGKRHWYRWGYNDKGYEPGRAFMAKLVRPGVGPAWDEASEAQIAAMQAVAAADPDPYRVWLLLNEPELGARKESAWALDPKGAAWWTWKAIRALKAVQPGAIIGGPNLYNLADNAWAEQYLYWFGHSVCAKTGRSVFDVWAVHDYIGRYESCRWDGAQWATDERPTYKVMEEHLAWMRAYSAAHYHPVAPRAPVWITETGALEAQTPAAALPAMAALDEWMGRSGLRLGVTAAYWFVSEDPDWLRWAPGTCLWSGGTLTETGRAWLRA